jgi:hypothetical protein
MNTGSSINRLAINEWVSGSVQSLSLGSGAKNNHKAHTVQKINCKPKDVELIIAYGKSILKIWRLIEVVQTA